MVVDLERFLSDQASIFSRFRDTTTVTSDGLKASPLLGQPSRGSYLIALRHPKEITEPIEALSRRITETVPALMYDKANIHTTLALYRAGPYFSPDESVLEDLAACVQDALPQLESPRIRYEEWLYNQDSVIIKGEAKADFFRLANTIFASLQQAGIGEIRVPWGGHITVSRFSEARSPDQLGAFFQLMKSIRPLRRESRPKYLDMGHTTMDGKEGFFYHIHRRFELEPF